jgi:hypothetical protein
MRCGLDPQGARRVSLGSTPPLPQATKQRKRYNEPSNRDAGWPRQGDDRIVRQLSKTSDGAVKTRERLFTELKAELELHTRFEEQHLFPILRRNPETKALVADAIMRGTKSASTTSRAASTDRFSSRYNLLSMVKPGSSGPVNWDPPGAVCFWVAMVRQWDGPTRSAIREYASQRSTE